ncbi:MAG: GAF domain-containing protein, partial [Candidatus Gastranaerophilaceae bacterium]
MKEIALFKNIMEKMGTTFDLEEVLTVICGELQKLFKVDKVAIGHLDPKTDSWVIFAEYITDKNIFSFKDTNLLINVKQYLKEYIIKKGENVIFDNIQESNLPDFYKEMHKQLGIKSILSVPIKKGNKVWGVLGFFQIKCYRIWNEKEIKFLQAIVEYIYLAIQRTELCITINKQAEKESTLRKTIETIRSSLDFEYTKNEIVNQIGTLLKADRVAIAYYDYESENYIISAKGEYRTSNKVKTFVGQDFKNIPGFVEFIRNLHFQGNDIIFNDLETYLDENNLRGTDVEKFYREYGFASSAAINMYYRNIFLGDLVITFEQQRDFSDDDIRFLKTIANQTGIALYQAKLFTMTKQLAKKEALLRKIVETIRSTLDINKIEKSIAREVGKVFKVDRCYIVDYDDEKDIFLPVKKHVEYLSSKTVKSVSGYDWSEMKVFANLIRQKKEINWEHIENFIKKHNLKEKEEEKFICNCDLTSTYNIPIVFADKLLGIFCMDYTKQYVKLTEENLDFIRVLATQTGIAMYQSKLYQSAKELADREYLLRSTVTAVRSTLDLKDIKHKIVNEIGKILSPDRILFAEYDKVNKKIFIDKYSEYLSSPDLRSFVDFNLSGTPGFEYIQEAHEQKKDVIYNNLDKFLEENNLKGSTTEKFLRSFNIQALAAICMIYKDQFLGNLVIQYTKNKNFTNEDLEFMRVLASQAGVAIYQTKLYESIKKTAEKERILREIIIEIKLSHSKEQVYKYILKKFADLFDFKRTFFVEISEFKPQKVVIKYKFNKNTASFNFQNIELPQIYIDELIKIINTQNKLLVNNIENYHPKHKELQEFFKKTNIKSFFVSDITKYNHEKITFGAIILCSDEVKNWSQYEINLLEEILNSIATMLWEISKREEIDELRNTFILTLAHDLQVPLVGERRALEFIMSIPPGQLLDKYKHIIAETIKSNINLS